MFSILYPNITSKEKMIEAIQGTYEYYVNHYPQRRLKGKTCGEVRAESLNQKEYEQYPIVPAQRYLKYWNAIEQKKQKAIKRIIE